MKLLPPLAVLLAVGIAGCSKSDPFAKYRDVQLTVGMKLADIKQQFGEPDSFDECWNEDPEPRFFSGHPRQESPGYPYHIQELNYGAFGAHDQKTGHITKHRLSMTFVDGKLCDWEKSTPIDGD